MVKKFTLTLWQTSLLLLFLPSTLLEEIDSDGTRYSCKRIVHEKERCLIYNYNHPNCKKWDRTNCPPPRIHRERGHCVSYKCRRISEWRQTLPVTTQVPVIVTNLTTSVGNETELPAESPPVPPESPPENNLTAVRAQNSKVAVLDVPVPEETDIETSSTASSADNLVAKVDDLQDEIEGLRRVQTNDLNQIRADFVTDGELEKEFTKIEKKIVALNSTIFGRLLKLENQLTDFENLVHRLYEASNATKVQF